MKFSDQPELRRVLESDPRGSRLVGASYFKMKLVQVYFSKQNN